MITQMSDTMFIFSYIIIQPLSIYGEDPYMDNLGAVSHLLPTHKMENQKEFKWIVKNNLPYSISTDEKYLFKYVEFENLEDAMAFKLRWE